MEEVADEGVQQRSLDDKNKIEFAVRFLFRKESQNAL